MKVIFIEYLKKSIEPSELEESLNNLAKVKYSTKDFCGFVKDVFYHDADRLINEENIKILYNILDKVPQRAQFLRDIIYEYFIKMKHMDKKFVLDIIEKKNNLPEEVKVNLIEKLKKEVTQKLTKSQKGEESILIEKWKEVLKEKDKNRKGTLLEELLKSIMGSIFGTDKVTTRRKTQTEEIDIVIRNEIDDEFWKKEGPLIIGECKNWSTKVGKNEVVLFRSKIENRFRRCKLGFLISINGFKKTAILEKLRDSKGIYLIVFIGRTELEKLIEANPEERNRLLKRFTEKSICR
jgi:hypothetical protein